MLGVISNIQRFTVHDGPGIRITIFLQGCPLDCWWCHNPESKSFCNQNANDENLRMTPEQLMTEIRKELVFMEESNGGVTFSGGEPFMQSGFLSKMLSLCKAEEIHTTVDTSGLVNKDVFNSLFLEPDLYLFDIKLIDPVKHKKYTGVSNSQILQNLKMLVDHKKEVNIRFPLIPGVNDTLENLNGVKKLMIQHHLKKINILPFHRIAEGKYEKLHMENRMKGIKAHSESEIKNIHNFFIDAGFEAKIGG